MADVKSNHKVDIEDEKHDAERGHYPPAAGRRRSSFVRQSMSRSKGYETEDPFGAEEGGDVQYRTLAWWQAAMLMIAETISLGILSLPSVLARVGFIPGIILILGLSVCATYSGYVLGQFKNRYPHVHTFADAGEILFKPIGMGAIGREVFGIGQVIFLVFLMGSHILIWTIMLNTLIGPGAPCTIIWSIVALLLFFTCDLPRTLKNLSWFSIASFISVVSACLALMIGVGIKPTNTAAIELTQPTVPFVKAFNSVSNIVFAYAGHIAFFSFISEFRKPQDFPKALYTLQAIDTSMYLVVAVVVYYFTGANVDSPALGSADPIVRKVAWALAIPTIIVAGVVYGHVASKYIYVRLFRGTEHLSSRSWFATLVWAGIVFILWFIAWVIAESIPVFNDLLALISALFASWFTYGLPGIFWLFMNKGQWWSTPTKKLLTVCNFGLVILGLIICVVGLYTSGSAIKADSGQGAVWSCEWNGQ